MGYFDNVGQLLARTTLALRAGVSFGGARNLYATFGYKLTPVHIDYVAKYLRQDVATRIINAPVDATWTEGPTISDKVVDSGADQTLFGKAWQDLVGKFPVYPALRKADIFAGLGAFSILVIGIDDGQKLNTPIKVGRKANLTYLQPYLEGSIQITEFDQDQTSARFGLPVMYRVTPGDVTTQRNLNTVTYVSRKNFDVHYTRVLHLADNTLENIVFGHSRLEGIYNALDDLLKVTGGAAETYWLASNRGMHVDVDKDMDLDEDDAKNLSAELDEYQHQLRRVIRTRGVKVDNLGSDIADPTGTFNVLVALLASQSGLPQRVMMGAEAGQLASQQDRANWSQRVAERIANFAEPIALIPFISKLVAMGVLPIPVGNIVVTWPEVFKMNPLERAQTSAQQARSLTNVAGAMQKSQAMQTNVVSIEEGRQIVAPGKEILILTGVPKGTFPPKISQPTAEPIDPNSLTPEQQLEQTTIESDALAQSSDTGEAPS